MTTGFIIGAGGGIDGGSGLELCDIGMALYVDETKGLRRYLNGQIVDINTNTQAFLNRLQQITTLHPSLLCTEEEWQTAKTTSAFGQVGKFVFNYSGDEIVSVRLPRVVNVQGLFDLQKLGMTVSAGLPNITGTMPISVDNSVTGAFKIEPATFTYTFTTSGNGNKIYLDNSLSNPIYGNSDTVQQEAIQYPYFIQIATGSETENNIINEIELNNPYSLFDSKYSDHELNNLSWLKSEGQWNAKATYPTVYEGLQVEYNSEIVTGTTVTLPSGVSYTKHGLSVKLSTEEYTDYDFRLNTTDETFRLPLLDGSEDLPGDNAENITFLSNGSNYPVTKNGYFILDIPVTGGGGQIWAGTSSWFDGSEVSGGNIQWTSPLCKRGQNMTLNYYNVQTPVRFTFTASVGNGSLYYYVGETVQNANLIDAGRIGEQLATKTDMLQASGAGMPSNKYIDLTLGASGSTYTAPANGWFVISKKFSASEQYIYMATKDDKFPIRVDSYSSYPTGEIFLPVSKNDTMILRYNAGGNLNYFRFYYAEGEQ